MALHISRLIDGNAVGATGFRKLLVLGPKEIMTLTLFLTVSVGQLSYFEKKYAATKWLVLISCALVILTGLSSFILA